MTGLLVSEDTEVMIDSWHRLGVKVDQHESGTAADVRGCGGELPVRKGDLFVANSGTTIRFMTAALSACHGEFVLDGVARMRQRPIGDLLEALQRAGVRCESLNAEQPDCPPVRMLAEGLPGGRIEVEGNVSSQFLSGLLLASPYARQPLEIAVVGELVSRPYVTMTTEVMQQFGPKYKPFQRMPGELSQGLIKVATTISSRMLQRLATSGLQRRLLVVKLPLRDYSAHSLQGDVHFCDALQAMGCEVIWGENSITVRGRT